MFSYLEKHKLLSTAITILIAIEIFYFSTLPGTSGINKIFPIKAIIYHFSIFFLFSFFLLLSTKRKGKQKPGLKHILFVIIISLCYAILDEVHQIFTPGRSPSIKDIFIDYLGSMTAILTYFYSKR